jgi:hypothetical protein
MVGAEVEALHGAIDVRMQVQGPDERLGAAARYAKNDKIELSGHRAPCVGQNCPPMIENFAPGGKR